MDSILVASEIDFYVETMKPQSIQDIGTSRWLEWHERLQKLYQQAIIEASAVKEEYVKETLISFNKSAVLVHEAILINVWKHKIFPLLLKLDANPETTFIAYSILYHEAIAVSLLELLMFHGIGCESLGDSAADLLDYAYDGATKLLIFDIKDGEKMETARCEISRQKEDIAFDIGIRCLSIIRYLAENLERVSLNITSGLYSTYDVPLLLIQILLQKPWNKNEKIYKQGKWISCNNTEALNQAEAQVWLTLRHLLLDEACGEHYAITDSRRTQLMKLLSLLTPTVMDQLSPLVELNRWLCQLSVSNLPSAPNKPLLLETVLEIKNDIVKLGDKKWKKIAREQVGRVFCNDKNQLLEAAQRLNAAFNTDLLEKFETTAKGSCTVCGKDAVQRCSRCKSDFYCSRSCQIDDWKNHKDQCLQATN